MKNSIIRYVLTFIEFYYDLLYHNGILCFLEPNMSQFYHIDLGGVFPDCHWSSLVIIGRHRLSLAVIGSHRFSDVPHTLYSLGLHSLYTTVALVTDRSQDTVPSRPTMYVFSFSRANPTSNYNLHHSK